MGALGVATGAIGFYGIAPAQLLTVTSAFAVFMVCSAAGKRPCFFQLDRMSPQPLWDTLEMLPIGNSSCASVEHLNSRLCIW